MLDITPLKHVIVLIVKLIETAFLLFIFYNFRDFVSRWAAVAKANEPISYLGDGFPIRRQSKSFFFCKIRTYIKRVFEAEEKTEGCA